MDDRNKPAAPGGLQTLGQREVPVRMVWVAICNHPAAFLIAFAIILDIGQYMSGRSYWLDEASLATALRANAANGFFQPLTNTQLAPPGFVAAERALLSFLGDYPRSLRLYPLACAIAALFVYNAVAQRCLNPRAALIALALYAVSDELIYFSSELKQYICDVAATLVCTLMGLRLATGPATVRRLLASAITGALIVWFSHPSAFVLAGVGTVLFVSALTRRDWRAAIAVVLISLAWLGSFAAVYRVGMTHLGDHSGMWTFWSFAFPPIPPRTIGDVLWPVRRLLYLFVNPLNFWTPLGTTVSALPAFGLFLVGCVSLARRDPLKFGILVAPGFFTLVASYLRLYPFHGRLILFLVPALLILIAAGAERVGRAANRRWVWVAILGALLAFPTLHAVWQLLEPREIRPFNPHGDRRPQWLDPVTFPFGTGEGTKPPA